MNVEVREVALGQRVWRGVAKRVGDMDRMLDLILDPSAI